MQRVGALINRLLEQYESGAGAESLALTAQMLLNELQQTKKPVADTAKKVAVIMPAARRAEPEISLQKETKLEIVNPVKVDTPPIEEITVEKELPIQKVAEIFAEPVKKPELRPVTPAAHSFDDIPTFAYQQKEIFELNDSMAEHKESLNESLKGGKTEIGSILKEAPVRDLRKAIGINDRFVFINELFRGDEDMYERSIKTINSFNIQPEAEYWIQRELKLKLGWNDQSDAVRQFDQLVRRRFS